MTGKKGPKGRGTRKRSPQRPGATPTAPPATSPAEREQAPHALQEGEEKYRLLFERASDAVFFVDNTSERILDTNSAASAMYGYSRGELLAMRNTDLSSEPDATWHVTKGTPVAADKVITIPLRLHRRKDGTVFPVEVTCRFFTWSGRPVHLATVRDTTERRRTEAALENTASQLTAVLGSTADGILAVDEAGKVLLANPRFREMWRIPEHVAASGDDQVLLDFVLEQLVDPEAFLAKVRALYQRSVEALDVLRFKDGRVFERYSRPLIDARGHLGRLWSFRDVTEQKRAEEGLRASEERYRHFFDLNLTGNFLSTPDGTLLACNPAFAAMLGFDSVEEALSARMTSLYATLGERQAFLDLLTRERVLRYRESRLARRDGRSIDVVENVMGIFDDAGNLQLLQGFLSDITEQKREREARREQEQLLSESQRIAHIGSWDFDLATGVLAWSAEMFRIFGVPPADFGGTADAFLQLLHPEDRDAMQEWIRACAACEEPADLEFRVVRPDGGLRWVLGRGTVECDAAQRPIRLVGTAQDITERIRMEEEEEKLQLQLAQAQKMEYVGRLAGGVAHDFNNALQTILLNVEEALDAAGESSGLREHLLDIRTAAQRSADLTRQLLAFARRQDVVPQTLDLNDTVAGMLKMLQRLIGEDIALAWLPGRDLWRVRMDPSQLDQVLANLAVNARDAIHGVGRLTVETANVAIDESDRVHHAHMAPGEYVQLTVTDDGCGMDAETVAHAFEPFFTTKEVGQGTGLGLATVYGIVKQNVGFVNVYSEPGHGTSFTIYLPRQHAEAPPATPAPTDAVRGGTETLLLVEDDPALLPACKTVLVRLGYTVLAANRPQEAIRAAEEHQGPIHLLITDVVMPEMSGRALVERLLVARPALKYVYMSGYTADVIAQRGVLDESVLFLQKPFNADALARKVREALDRP